MKKVMFLVVCLSVVSMVQADIISFEAEDVGIVAGNNWELYATGAALGGAAITPITPHGGDLAVEAEIRTYMIDLPAGTYSLYARVNKRTGAYNGWSGPDAFWNDSAFFSDSSLSDTATLFKYNSMLGDTGLDGVSTVNNFAWTLVQGTFVQAADGTAYFRAAPREPLLIDAFAFVTQGQTVTNEMLGVPEPATMALLGLGSLVALKRRRG